MFKSDKYYIIVSNSSFIIKKDGGNIETVIELQSFMPNVPAYHHLYDIDKKDYIDDIKRQIKKLKIKDAIIIMPDDTIELEVDKRMLIEFFLQVKVNKIQVSFQCYYMSFDNKKYISISKTNRIIVLQYISHNKTVIKKYYDKNYIDIEQVKKGINNIHDDNMYSILPVYINNINNDMEEFKDIGNLVSLDEFVANVMKNEIK
ncbi:MAG: hypothetical protein AB7V48_17165 [Sedimentibacter sp.]